MTEPPLEDGAVQVRVTVVSPAVAVNPVGAPGAEAGGAPGAVTVGAAS